MSDTAIYTQIIDAVADKCKHILPQGVTATNIKKAKVPTDRDSELPALPGILIAPFGPKRAPPTEGTNLSDDIEYPVVVVLIQASNQDQETSRNRAFLWHERVIKAFIHQRLPAVKSVFTCIVDPRDVFDSAAYFKQLDAGGIILRFKSRERRGA